MNEEDHTVEKQKWPSLSHILKSLTPIGEDFADAPDPAPCPLEPLEDDADR